VKKQFRGYCSIVLIAVIVVNLFSCSALSFLLKITERNFSNEFSAGDEVELIKIPLQNQTSGFHVINDHELVYRKKMYDIVRSFVKDNVAWFYCVNDFKEEKILQGISECTSLHLDCYSTEHSGTGQNVFKVFTTENFYSVRSPMNLPELSFVFQYHAKQFPELVYVEKTYPPPEFFVC
jgi:hypothetical protein